MEGPLPPLTKIDDDVEGVGVEVMLALKSMRRGRGCGGHVPPPHTTPPPTAPRFRRRPLAIAFAQPQYYARWLQSI